ncbi:MAG: hypothetical protein ACJ71Q_09090 [Terriglobales bacterium]
MTTIEELQKIVNDTNRGEQERRAAAEHILKLRQTTETETEEERTRRRLLRRFGHLLDVEYQITDLDRQEMEVERQEAARHDELKRIAGDESRPMDERLRAAKDWRAGLDEKWRSQFDDATLVKTLTPHRHLKRLQELRDFIYDIHSEDNGLVKYRVIEGDLSEYVAAKKKAIEEFRRLGSEYPLRRDGTPAIESADSYIRYQIHKAKEKQVTAVPPVPKEEPQRLEITAEQLAAYFDRQIAELGQPCLQDSSARRPRQSTTG